MVRSYSKYEFSQSFGVITSATSNTIWAAERTIPGISSRATGAGRAYSGANEDVLCWDIKKGELLSRWRPINSTAHVSTVARSHADLDIFAVGYSDGSIRLWDANIATVIITFNGHRSAVTSLAFDSSGARLASGSKDTDIIIWDLVGEVGLFKLRGHKDQIVGLHFLSATQESNTADLSQTYLISASKDALVKLWDIASQYCLETHVTQSNGECWALRVSPDDQGFMTGGNDGEVRVWSIDAAKLATLSTAIDREPNVRTLFDRGTLVRQSGRERITGVHFHSTTDYFAIHGAERSVEIWRTRSPEEVRKVLARKRRRKREKAVSTTDGDQDTNMANDEDMEQDGEGDADMKDRFVLHSIIRTGGKVRSVDWAGGRPSKQLQLIVATTNNQIELYTVSTKPLSKKSNDEAVEYNRVHAVELPAHRTDVRSLALSSDDKMLATASNGSLKIWNMRTEGCLRTLECGYALCVAFLPGDKIVLVGNKDGTIELFDVAASTLIDSTQAHDGAIWTMKVHPDGKSVVTGSADKSAKFWDFTIVQEDIPGTRRTTPKLKLKHTKTLKLGDDILSLCFSPDSGRLIAASTLDNTVKVFFTDSLKLFLNLYGHKLPVLSMSISSDSKLIATCSADKTVRIWGLDFGDCHKSFLAHDESIMAVAFPAHALSRDDAHIVFSAGKDGLVKTWDADKFEAVQTLRGHTGEIWAMALSATGDFSVTAAHDRSIRVWRQTDEPLFLEEERERELDESYDAALEEQLARDARDELAMADRDAGAVDVVAASKQTSETLTAGERIVEALTLCAEDLEVVRAHAATGSSAAPTRHPLLALRNVSAEQHLLGVIEAIPAPALEDALLLLSFSLLPQLFVFLAIWLQREMNVPLTCRIMFTLLRIHHKQVVAAKGQMRLQLLEIRERLALVLGKEKDVLGFNLAACKILGRRIGDSKVSTMEELEKQEGLGGASGKKRTFVSVA